MDKENSLSEELADCRVQVEDIENNQLSNLKNSSEEMLQAYNENLQICKVHRLVQIVKYTVLMWL